MKFNKEFEFGASMSAIQTEGNGITKMGKTTFHKYFEDNPDLFYEKVGPETTCDITRSYKKDINIFKTIGFQSIRTGFSWSRLYPDGQNIDKEAVNFYHSYIDEYKKNNIKLFMTLFHFDMPLWAFKKGGWSSREVIEKFKEYAVFVFKEFGQKIDYFVTFNEPLVPIFEGYLGDKHYPGINDPKEAVNQAYGFFLAHSKVLLEFKKFKLNSKIGLVFNWNYTYPYSQNKEDVDGAIIYDAFVNRGPLEIMLKGKISKTLINSLNKFNLLPHYTNDELDIISKTEIDFLGVNYYFPCRVKKNSCKIKRWDLDELKIEIPPNSRINKFRGWEIYPEALYDIGMEIKNKYNNIPWYIAENGMGVENEESYRNDEGFIEDDYRIDFIKEHLKQIETVIKEGSNCFGYHLWCAMDSWSFRNAFKNRYGLIEVNTENQKRIIKKSGYWFKELIKNREVE